MTGSTNGSWSGAFADAYRTLREGAGTGPRGKILLEVHPR
jgi:hypothetical protein